MSGGRAAGAPGSPLAEWVLLASGPVWAGAGLLLLLSAPAGAPEQRPWLLALGLAGILAGGLLWLRALRRLGRLLEESLDLAARVRRALAGEEAAEGLERGLREALLRELAYSFGRVLARLEQVARQEAAERRLLRSVLEAIPSGVAVIDARRQVRLANRRLAELLGARVREAEGRYYGLLLEDARVGAAVERVLAGQPAPPLEIPRRQDGREQALWVSVAPFPAEGGEPPGAILVLHDVTEVRRLERARRDLVANVSHELKTPIAAIVGIAETLAAGEASPPEAERFLALLRREAERMARLVDGLLRLARLESPEFVPARRPLDAGELLRAVAERFDPLARRRRQRLEVSAPPVPVPLQADPELLEEALSNLVANAVQYTPEGGRIRLELQEEPAAVVFRVQDDGPGIPEAHQARLFERFYRPDEGRSRRTGGVGLGLAIVKHVAQVHGGDVGVDSRPGEGATFWIRLPR